MTLPLARLSQAIAIVAPYADAAMWAAALAGPMQAADITTPRRIAMFVGQVAEETGGFSTFEEDLYYTTAKRMCEVWPTHFPLLADAAPYIGEPERLANRVYAGRMGNGDTDSGDGWRFRGRGLIQLTGRTLYTDFALDQGRDPEEIADWLVTPQGAAVSACWYWAWAYHGRLNTLADAWRVTSATTLINGDAFDVPRRLTLCGAALSVFIPVKRPAPPVESAGEREADRLDDLYNPGA